MALQGIVNRDAPRLFIISQMNSRDRLYARYLEKEKGFRFVELPSLGHAVRHFAQSGLIKGLVQYDAGGYEKTWTAATWAGLEDGLPVTAANLAGKTPLLAGNSFWTQDDCSGPRWAQMFTQAIFGSNGMPVSASAQALKVRPNFGAYRGRWVWLDRKITPKIQIEVTEVSGEWGLTIAADSADNPQSFVALTRQTTGGTFTLAFDSPLLPERSMAEIRFCPLTPDTRFTVRSVKLLGADGTVPPVAFRAEDWFAGLKVVRDLRGKIGDEDTAAQDAVRDLLPRTAKSLAFLAKSDWFELQQMDWAIANRAFIFWQNKTPYKDEFPIFEAVLRHLAPPAYLAGWSLDETYLVHKVSTYGHRVAPGMPNLSFWARVPLSARPQLPQTRHVKRLEAKYYVNFGVASGDALNIIAGLYENGWLSADRGKVPISWGLDPMLAEIAPAFVEFFAKNATPLDSFWIGPSGSGYCHPSVMPPPLQARFAERTRRDVATLGISPALDLWDAQMHRREVYAAFAAPGNSPPLQLIEPNLYTGSPARNWWTDDGTPVIAAEHTAPDTRLMPLWESAASGLDLSDPAGDVARRIQRVAANNQPPFFIALNIRVSPAILRKIQEFLPRERFSVVGMPDFIALAREAGGFTVEPESSGVAAGDKLALNLTLRNPDGLTGKAGTVTWTLPPGWTAGAGAWRHGAVARGGVLRYRLEIQAPPTLARGAAKIALRESSAVCGERLVETQTYPAGRLVSDGTKTDGWRLENDARAAVESGGLRLLPPEPITSETHKAQVINGPRLKIKHGNAVLSLGQLDMARRPLVELLVAESRSDWNARLRVGKWNGNIGRNAVGLITCDVTKLSAQSGKQDAELSIDPMGSCGESVLVRSVRMFYQN